MFKDLRLDVREGEKYSNLVIMDIKEMKIDTRGEETILNKQ